VKSTADEFALAVVLVVAKADKKWSR